MKTQSKEARRLRQSSKESSKNQRESSRSLGSSLGNVQRSGWNQDSSQHHHRKSRYCASFHAIYLFEKFLVHFVFIFCKLQWQSVLTSILQGGGRGVQGDLQLHLCPGLPMTRMLLGHLHHNFKVRVEMFPIKGELLLHESRKIQMHPPRVAHFVILKC